VLPAPKIPALLQVQHLFSSVWPKKTVLLHFARCHESGLLLRKFVRFTEYKRLPFGTMRLSRSRAASTLILSEIFKKNLEEEHRQMLFYVAKGVTPLIRSKI
jgi:hypothetical protein